MSYDDDINSEVNEIWSRGSQNRPSVDEMLIQQYIQWLVGNHIPYDEEHGRMWEYTYIFKIWEDEINHWRLTITYDGQYEIDTFCSSGEYTGVVMNGFYIKDAIVERVSKGVIPWSSKYDVQLAARQALYARTEEARKRAKMTIMQERVAGQPVRSKRIAKEAQEKASAEKRRDELIAQFFLWVRDYNVPYNHRRVRPGAKPGFWSEKYRERDYERLVLLGSLDNEHCWHVFITETGMRTVNKTYFLEEKDVKKAIKEMVEKTGIPWPYGNLD